uniref:SCP domain-containing protein n=1 Tax=Anopheles dirus TaxID=7168 RepID=A0A1Y9H350_9DIPT
MANWIFVTIVGCLFSGIQAQIDYCAKSYCTNTYPNIGCNPPASPGGVGCNGKSPAVVALTSDQQTLILNEHNTRRSQLALGNLSPFTPAIGHFTQMASDQTNKVGCAMQYWLDDSWETYYLVCNYGVTNVIGTPVYKSGPVASACTTGRNPLAGLNGLCSTAESISPVPNPTVTSG